MVLLPNDNDNATSEAHDKIERKRKRRVKKDDGNHDDIHSNRSVNTNRRRHATDTATTVVSMDAGTSTIRATGTSKMEHNGPTHTDSSSSSSSNHNHSRHTSRKRRRGNSTKASTTPPALILTNPPSLSSHPQRNASIRNHHHPQKQQQPQQDRARTKAPLSPAVLEFSAKLKELVRQKNLPALLECYSHHTNDTIRDEHHACIVIDACAKGGGSIENNNPMEIAEQILADLQPKPGTLQDASPPSQLFSFNVETLTALLKVYVHSGDLCKGWELFRNQIVHPNVRTLNTLLRGCLWSAVTITATNQTSTRPPGPMSHSQPIPSLCGGVITSENAWQHYRTNCGHPIHRQPHPQQCLDTSSYEYSIQLLCQSLQVDVATKRIEEYCAIHNIRFKGTAKIISQHNSNNNIDKKNALASEATTTASATIYETLAVAYLALSRAYGILMALFLPNIESDIGTNHGALLWTSCQRCLSAIKFSRTILTKQQSDDATSDNHIGDAAVTATHNPKIEVAVAGSGGKRGWKTGQQQQRHPSTQREFSNQAYRTHRLSELEMEVLSLLKHCKLKHLPKSKNDGTCDQNQETNTTSVSEATIRRVVQQLQNKLLYFSGGALTSTTTSTNNNSINDKMQNSLKQLQKQRVTTTLGLSDATAVRQQLLVASWYSFGLSQIFAIITKNQDHALDYDTASVVDDDTSTFDKDYRTYTKMQQSTATTSSTSVIDEDGMINIEAIFNTKNRPLDIEIGAGFGTWIVEQAKRNSDRNYIAMELRADRCYQIYTRSMLQYTEPLSNVCVIGCDCNGLLRERMQHNTVSTFYAHHPEPPNQVLGDNNKFLQQLALANNPNVVEPTHMLHSTTILYMCQCLKKDGCIVIVSDNRSYIRLVAATFTKIVRQHVNVLRTVPLNQIKKGIIPSFNDGTILQSLHPFETFQSVVDICAYDNHKITTNTIGNGNNGTSYFDRLWRTGAGTHSEMHTRFVIVMQRKSGVV